MKRQSWRKEIFQKERRTKKYLRRSEDLQIHLVVYSAGLESSDALVT